MSQETFEREQISLIAALDELKIDKRFIITIDSSLDYEILDNRIHHICSYDWLLRD